MNSDTRLAVFQELIGCYHNLYLWTYDRFMCLLSSSCPDEETVANLLVFGNHNDTIIEFFKSHRKPLVMTDAMGLMWLAAPEKDGSELRRIHALGPFFTDDATARQIGYRLREMEISEPLRHRALSFLQSLPVISLNRIIEYAIMLHFCITGEKITVSDLLYRKDAQGNGQALPGTVSPNTHGTYAAEQELLRMVREGNLNYSNQLSRLALTGNMGTLSRNHERHLKNLTLAGITLFSRAAIEGGVSPEISLTLSDQYFQSVENCSSMTELMDINDTMMRDYVERVHRCRQDPSISAPVRSAMDYIALHLEEELTLKQLAELTGYSEYYFSKRFKQEAGVTPKEYIRGKRLERAKFLLRTTQTSVQDISEALRFGSQSYFADAFRRGEGISPTAYREQFQNRMTPLQKNRQEDSL